MASAVKSMGFFNNKRDYANLGEQELLSDLREICDVLKKKECWTAVYFEKNGIPSVEVTQVLQEQIANLKKELEEVGKQVEVRKAELGKVNEETEEAKRAQRTMVQLLAEEEQKLKEVKEAQTSSATRVDLEPVKQAIKDEVRLAIETITSKGDLEPVKQTIKEEVKLALETLVGKIDNENRDLVNVLDKVEDKLSRKEADVQRFQEDSLLKLTSPYLRQFISLGDMMRSLMNDVPEAPEEALPFLKENMDKLLETIDFILRDFSVEVYRHNPEDKQFDVQRQQQVADCPTDDPALDKMVSRTVNPGYIWTLPYILRAKVNGEELPVKKYQFVFRAEQVECYKYNNNK